MNIEALTMPINEVRPCGSNIRENTSSRELYFRLKDTRGLARAAERALSSDKNANTSPIWGDVSNLGLQLFTAHGKDIEVLAWLIEAQLRLDGFRGLRAIYQATLSLLEHHFDDLHSIGNDDDEERFAPLAGLNGVGSEGTLIQAIRLAPLVPGGKFGQFSLWDYQVSQRPGETGRREELQHAATEVGSARMAEHFRVVNACVSLFDRITAILGQRCGENAPPSSNTRTALVEAASAIRFLARLGEEAAVDAEAEPAAPGELLPGQIEAPSSIGDVRPAKSFDRINSREEAFEILLIVARYFRKTEPHSPISMSIETLVRRGRMDFPELLAELLPDANQRQAVLSAAGIRPTS